MQVPLQITFRNMESSEAVEADIRKRVDNMNRRHAEIKREIRGPRQAA